MQVDGVDAILIIPKRHVKSIIDLKEEEYLDFCNMIKYVYQKMKLAGWDKFNILINEGLVAGQTVPHLHAHVFSRKEKDGIKNMIRKNRKNIFKDWSKDKTQKFIKRINSYFQS